MESNGLLRVSRKATLLRSEACAQGLVLSWEICVACCIWDRCVEILSLLE